MLSSCLKSADQDGTAVSKLELLKEALETWNFPSLRAGYRTLAGGQDSTVTLVTDESGRPGLKIDDQFILPN